MNRTLFTSMFLLTACFEDTGPSVESETGETDGDATGDTTDDGDADATGDTGETTGDTTDGTDDTTGDTTDDGDGDTTDTTDETGDGDPVWPEPYAFWLFDGDLLDSVGDAHGTDPADQVEYDVLDNREGVRFIEAPDGGSGHIVVEELAEDILGWVEFSIALRAYAEPGAVKQTYMSLGLKDEPNENPSENGFGVWLAEAGGVHVYSETEGAVDQWLFLGSRPDENAWHTLVWTFSQGSVRYYEDGALISEMPYYMSVTSTTSLVIGGWYGYHPFAGLLDQAAVFDRELTSGEVLAMSR